MLWSLSLRHIMTLKKICSTIDVIHFHLALDMSLKYRGETFLCLKNYTLKCKVPSQTLFKPFFFPTKTSLAAVHNSVGQEKDSIHTTTHKS